MQILSQLWTDLSGSFTATPPSVAALLVLAALALLLVRTETRDRAIG